MDNDFFTQIYQKYAKPLFQIMLKMCGNYDIAEELTQETFVKAYEKLDSFRGDCQLYVWLCQIGKNLYFNYLKKEEKYTHIPDTIQSVSLQNVEDEIIQTSTAREIMEAVVQLPEPYQSVFVYRIFSEFTYKEIGDVLRKTDVWARVTYYRAKKQLHDILKEEMFHEM